jgi:hypothetical protein
MVDKQRFWVIGGRTEESLTLEYAEWSFMVYLPQLSSGKTGFR